MCLYMCRKVILMTPQQVSPFNEFKLARPEVKIQGNSAVQAKIEPSKEKDVYKKSKPVNNIENKSLGKHKSDMKNNILIGAVATAWVVILGLMGKNGCFGKSIQKFLGGIEKSEIKHTPAFKAPRIKKVLESNYNDVIEMIKKEKCPYGVDVDENFKYMYFDNQYSNRIVLAYDKAENGLLRHIISTPKSGQKVQMKIANGKKIHETAKTYGDYVLMKRYSLLDNRPEMVIYNDKLDDGVIYQKSRTEKDGSYTSTIFLPENWPMRKNYKGKTDCTYTTFDSQKGKTYKSTFDEYTNDLIDLYKLTGIKSIV